METVAAIKRTWMEKNQPSLSFQWEATSNKEAE